MSGINVAEYVNYVFETGIYNDIDYHYVTLGILPPNTNNMYIKTDLHNIYVNMNGEWYILIDRKIGEPVFTDNSKIIIYKKYFSNLKEDTLITSYGRAICNKILLNDVFGDHIEYRNSEFNIDDVSSDIAKLLASRIISVDDLMACGVACQFMEQLSTLVTISCTNKLMTPPPGIDQYKQTLVEEFNKEFGSNWVSDRKHITNFTDKLLKYDDDYLKDDPTYGIVADKKVKNVSRAKLFGSMGAPKEFDSYDMSPSIIINSLHQGYPLDNPVLLAKTFNTARSGSYDRGAATQMAGYDTKVILRVTSGYQIRVDFDCGSKIGYIKVVTPNNYKTLIGRYIILGGSNIELLSDDNIKNYIGKIVILRSPYGCAMDPELNTFCSVCMGKNIGHNPNGINVLATELSGALLKLKMKSMHDDTVKVTRLDITKTLS